MIAVFARLRLALLALAVSLAACGTEPEPRGPTVLAAASMQEAMQEAADAWTARGHLPPILSFAGTGSLARQVAIGAPADLFISADERWMDWLEQAVSLKPGTRSVLATNALVLIAPQDSSARFPRKNEWATALGQGRLAIAEPGSVPAGRYARAALMTTGVWDEVRNRVAETADVRGTLMLVARGDAPLGIVYASDAQADPRVRIVGTFDKETHAPIRYLVAIPARSRHPDAASFRAFLLSEHGQSILSRHGFGPIVADEGSDRG